MVRYALFFTILIACTIGLTNCNTYYQKTRLVQESFEKGKFKYALEVVRNTNFYLKPKNEFLYHVESGTLQFFAQHLQEAQDHFNAADYFEEDYNTRQNTAKDVTKEILWNSAASTYKGDYFERFMIHYYKILIYLAENKNDEARVEARRLQIRLQQLHDLSENKDKKYASDAFMHIMQGMVYERLEEYNNAFISYQNAYHIFADNDSISNNIPMPEQLRFDLLRMAKYSGFTDSYENYQEQWQIPEEFIFTKADAEGIIFWENGLVPIKAENNFVFAAVPLNGTTVFYCSALNFIFPIPDYLDFKGFSPSQLGILRVATPQLVNRPSIIKSAHLSQLDTNITNGIPLIKITDISELAHRSLKDNRKRNLSIALSRAIINKVSELALSMASESSKNKGTTSGSSLKIASLLTGILGIAKEKADTRSWLTLPAGISYARIPLHLGNNDFKMVFTKENGSKSQQLFRISCPQKGLYIRNIRTPSAFPPDPLKSGF